MNGSDDGSSLRSKTIVFRVLIVASAVLYGTISLLSRRFATEVPEVERPTILMLALLAAAFGLYWSAIAVAIRLPASRRLIVAIVGSACLFRAVLIPSTPMHEIDVYRYIWDGAVGAESISPYRYTPQQVLAAAELPADAVDEELRRLVALLANDDGLRECLLRIHYAELPSPYPLVSQRVFQASTWLTPDGASQHTRLVIMKLVLGVFDVATLLVLIGLLQDVGRHPGWSVAYGWCPLVLKEFANSGHLDLIAIFLTMFALWMLVRTCRSTASTRRSVAAAALVGGIVALAIGAKLYPVVLLPLFAAVWLRRLGWLPTVCGLGVAALMTTVLLQPMIGSEEGMQAATTPADAGEASIAPDEAAGIREFLLHWEMNDLLFMVVVENLRPQEDTEPFARPWFVVTSDDWARGAILHWNQFTDELLRKVQPTSSAEPDQPFDSPRSIQLGSFLLARVLTGGATLLIACWLALRSSTDAQGPSQWCRAAMLILAWFWLLCPTQNPWYWCWVVPLLPFARYRAWCAVSACCMLYYLRFWLSSHYPDPPVLGTRYDGVHFFYFVVAWVEFAPFLLALFISWWVGRQKVPPIEPTNACQNQEMPPV